MSVALLCIISRYICHKSPVHSSGNGAPWPGLCAQLTVRWKWPKDSRQEHILTHAADIHLAPDTVGADLSSLLNNNMVDHQCPALVFNQTHKKTCAEALHKTITYNIIHCWKYFHSCLESQKDFNLISRYPRLIRSCLCALTHCDEVSLNKLNKPWRVIHKFCNVAN